MPRHVALFAIGLLLLAVPAFWPLYLSKGWAAVDRYTHAHAALGTLWMFFLVVQPALVLRHHRRAHRLAGRAALLVALGFVASGVLLTHYRVSRMTEAAFAKEGIYIYLPLSIAALFATACVLGLRWRTSTPVHARFMLSTALLLVDPLVARLMFFYLPPLPSDHFYQGITFTVMTAAMAWLVASLPAHTPGRVCYRNYCLGAAAAFALFFAVPTTAPWRAFVSGFRALPLT